jgi:hypothetical protein
MYIINTFVDVYAILLRKCTYWPLSITRACSPAECAHNLNRDANKHVQYTRSTGLHSCHNTIAITHLRVHHNHCCRKWIVADLNLSVLGIRRRVIIFTDISAHRILAYCCTAEFKQALMNSIVPCALVISFTIAAGALCLH